MEKLNKLKKEWLELCQEYSIIGHNDGSSNQEELLRRLKQIENTFKTLDLKVQTYQIENN